MERSIGRELLLEAFNQTVQLLYDNTLLYSKS